MRCSLLILLVALTSVARAQPPQPVDLVALLKTAHLRGDPIPLVSMRRLPVTRSEAAMVQAQFVRWRLESDDLTGFKAAVTSKAMQSKFGLDAPVSGVLMASMRHLPSRPLEIQKAKHVMIETEIGFVIGRRITQRLADVADLQAHVRSQIPVIELPSLAFADMESLKGVDVIAGNTGAHRYILGEPVAMQADAVSRISVRLSIGDEIVNSAPAGDATGDPWAAALWLVNTVVDHGWQIEADHVIFTGAMGKMIPAEPGDYRADFGDLGEVTFVLRNARARQN